MKFDAMTSFLRSSICVLWVMVLLQGCNVQKTPKAPPLYYPISLLKVPKTFLPKPKKCMVWFPDFSLANQPYTDGCDSGFLENRSHKWLIMNTGSQEQPIYKVTQLVPVEGGFNAKLLHFSDQGNLNE